MRSRQVHLDFHTSEFIPEIGGAFDKKAFVERLQAAHVDSITCFARCHHGWLYYPSQRQPEMIHPELKNHELLIEQIDACHEANIDVPVYTTVQWDGYISRHHPEWLSVDEQGEFINTQGIPEPHFYYTICLNSPYRDYFKAHLLDMFDSIGREKIDGVFMDILFAVDCHCQYCQEKMADLAIDASVKKNRLMYSKQMLHEFKAEISALIWQEIPETNVFFNGSHIGPHDKADLPSYSHLELESLPSGGWGYDHFPITARYARNLGKEVIGMTGKFHTYWGDFHSLKNQPALEFEVFNMFALGALGASIGDQLHPDGVLSKAGYDLIGQVYGPVAKIEADCKLASRPIVEIGVLTPEEYWVPGSDEPRTSPELIGVTRLLQELNYQFNIIDSTMAFSDYQVLILPDSTPYSRDLEEELLAFVARGGKIIGSYEAMIEKAKVSQLYGIKHLGPGKFQREFIIPNDVIGKALPKEEHVFYLRGQEVVAERSQVLLNTVEAYFNREGKTFISHQHAPSSRQVGSPAVTVTNGVYYFSQPIFRSYRKNAPAFIKELLKDVLEQCLPMKQLIHNGPSTLLTTVNESVDHETYLIHSLHYITEKKSEDIYTIENYYPLADIELACYVAEKSVKKVTNILTDEEIDFDVVAGYVSFKLPVLQPHSVFKVQMESSQ